MKTIIASTIALALTATLAAQTHDPRTREQDIRPGTVTPSRNYGPVQGDAAPMPVHPEAYNQPMGEGNGLAAGIMSQFARAYADAGSPRVAILYNQTFGTQITSWTMEAKDVFQEAAGVGYNAQASQVTGVTTPYGGSLAATSAQASAAGGMVRRTESFTEFQSARERAGFTSEYVQWMFEDGFAKPFLAAGVHVVDSTLVMQVANRREDASANKQRIVDVNANLDAVKQHADWLVEVLMVPDGRAVNGYLFRATVKRLSDGRVLGNAMSSLDDFRAARERTKVVATDRGYQFVADDSGKPTIEEYAQSVAVKLLADLTPKLAALK